MPFFKLNADGDSSKKPSVKKQPTTDKTRDFLDDYNNIFRKNFKLPSIFDSGSDEDKNNFANISDESQFSKEISIMMQDDEYIGFIPQSQEEVEDTSATEEDSKTEEEIQAEKIEQYSEDPEFSDLCQQYFGNLDSSGLTPSEMFNTHNYVSFDDLTLLHDTLQQKNNLNVQLKAVQDFYYSNNMEMPDDVKSSIDALSSTNIYDTNNISGSYLFHLQANLENIGGILTGNLDKLQASNYNVECNDEGQITSISMTLKNSEGKDVSSVIKYREDGKTPLTKTTTTTDEAGNPVTTTTTYDENGNSVTTGDNGTLTSEQASLANLGAASANTDYTSGQMSDNINAFLSSDGSMPLTDDLSEATSLEDVFEAMVIANNGDKSTARTMLNAMLANEDVKAKLNGSEIYIDDNNQIVKDGVVAEGYLENPFQNTENLAINAMFDITNGRYVISDEILSALSEKTKKCDEAGNILSQTEYYTDVNGNIYTRNIENTYDENGTILETSATTYDPSTNAVKCTETSQFIEENGETKIQTTKTDANGNVILTRTETVDEYQNTQQLESIARKYTDKDDLSQEDLEKYLTVDSLTKDNDQAMEMLFDQLADEGIITKGWDLLKQITTLGIDKKEIADVIVQNKSNIDQLVEGMKKDDGSFEAKYKELYGVEYNQDTINQARLLQAEVQIYTGKQAEFTQIDAQLKDAYNNGDDETAIQILTGIYGDETVAKEKYQEYTDEQEFLSDMAAEMSLNMNDASQVSNLWEEKFVDFYGEEVGKAKFSKAMSGNLADNIDYDNCNFNNIGSIIYDDLNNNLSENFKAQGIDTSTLVQDYVEKYSEAFGSSSKVDITKMVQDYANDQNQVIDRVAGLVQGAGTVLMVGGVAIAMASSGGAAAPIAAWMLTAGKTSALVGIFSQDAAHLINEATSKNASAEDINNILYDAAQDVAMYYSGRMIGKLSNGAQTLLSQSIVGKGGSKLASAIAGNAIEIAIDAPLSIAASYAITGKASLEGEGFSQMLSLMTGIAQETIHSMKANQTSINGNDGEMKGSGLAFAVTTSGIKNQVDGNIKTEDFTPEANIGSEAYNKALTEISFNTSGYTTEEKSIIAGLMVTNNCDVYVAKTVLDNNYSAEQSKAYFDLVQQGLDSTSAKYMMDGYDLETAKSLAGRDAYTYNESMSQIILRKGYNLDKLSQNTAGSLTKYFIESGYDNLSKPLQSDTTVYRVVRTGGDSDYEINWKIGDEFTEKGFTSTSPEGNGTFAKESERIARRDNAQLANIEINVPAGTKVVNMGNAYDEILLKNGSTFKVTGYNAETNTYTLDLVPTTDSKLISDSNIKPADTDIKTESGTGNIDGVDKLKALSPTEPGSTSPLKINLQFFAAKAGADADIVPYKPYHEDITDPKAYEVLYSKPLEKIKEDFLAPYIGKSYLDSEKKYIDKVVDTYIKMGFNYEYDSQGNKVLIEDLINQDFSTEKYSDYIKQGVRYVSQNGNLYNQDGSLAKDAMAKRDREALILNLVHNRSYTHDLRSSGVNLDDTREISRLQLEFDDPETVVQKYIESKYQGEELSGQALEVAQAKVRFTIEKLKKIDGEYSALRPNLYPKTYYRGIKRDNYGAQMLLNAKVGDVVTPDNGYAFAARTKSTDVMITYCGEGGILLKLNMPIGAKISKRYDLQNQVLINRNASYKVKSITQDQGVTIFTLDYVRTKK